MRPTAPSSARRTPSCSPTGSAGWCSTARSTCRSTPRPRPRAGRRLRDRAAGLRRRTASTHRRLLPRRLRRRGAASGSATSSTEVDAEPLPTGDDRELTVGNAFYGIVTPLYNRDYWFLLSTAPHGRPSTATARAAAALRRLHLARPRRLHDNSCEAIYAINCLDDPYAIPASRGAGEIAAFEKASPTFGGVFAWGLIGCGGIQVESTEEPLEIDGDGRRPDRRRRHHPRPGDAVRVGGRRWPTSSSRASWSRRDGDGHTGYNSGNECVDDGRRGLPDRRHRPRRRPHQLLTRRLARSARRSPGSAWWPARSSAGRRATAWRRRGARWRGCRTAAAAATPSRRRAPAGGAAARPRRAGSPSRRGPCPTSSTAVSTSSTSIRVCGLRPVSCSIWRSTIRVESVGAPGRLGHDQLRPRPAAAR